MSYLKEEEDYLIEACQRRNLLVHNGGEVNGIYLNKVPEAVRGNLEIGSPIKVSQSYLDETIGRFELFFTLVSLELWKKLAPSDSNRANTIMHLNYQHMCAKRWRTSEGLSFFLMNDRQQNEISCLIGKMNYWLSRKGQGEFTDLRQEVQDADFSAKEIKFSLGKYALLDDENNFFELLPQALRSESITKIELDEWPLFESMRGTDTYKIKYLESK